MPAQPERNPIMIPQPYRDNFQTLHRAFDAGEACLLECHERVTGKPVYVLCAVNFREEVYELVPFAQLFDDNPYERLTLPGEMQKPPEPDQPDDGRTQGKGALS
jgi:hypothetical protein